MGHHEISWRFGCISGINIFSSGKSKFAIFFEAKNEKLRFRLLKSMIKYFQINFLNIPIYIQHYENRKNLKVSATMPFSCKSFGKRLVFLVLIHRQPDFVWQVWQMLLLFEQVFFFIENCVILLNFYCREALKRCD